jgi:hypothetical protein
LPQDIIDEILLVWEDIKTGRAINKEAKAKMIELYNTIHMTKYSVGTNCALVYQLAFKVLKLYKKNTANELFKFFKKEQTTPRKPLDY